MTDVLDDAAPMAVAAATPVGKPKSASTAAPPPIAASVSGLSPMTWAFAVIAVSMLLWGGWVTKHIVLPPPQAGIASVRLEALVTEYVQAQSHSSGSPDAVTQQTARFMGAIEDELKRIGATGTTVLVGEAVLSRNVPDITDQVRRAVYARVPLPTSAPAIAPPVRAPAAASSLPAAALPAQFTAPAVQAVTDATPALEGSSNGPAR